jgi:hypothetical protein
MAVVSIGRVTVEKAIEKSRCDPEPSEWNDVKKRDIGQRETNKGTCTTTSCPYTLYRAGCGHRGSLGPSSTHPLHVCRSTDIMSGLKQAR